MGCSTPPRSSRLTIDDFNHTVAEIEARLLESDFLQEQTAASPRMVVTINKVTNLTGDVITPAEQWMFVAHVRDRLAASQHLRRRNVAFQVEPERRDTLRGAGYRGDFGPIEAPTHLMAAEFRSAIRAARTLNNDARGHTDARTDYYALAYHVTRLTDNQRVWSDAVEFKRQAFGLIID